MPIWIRVGNIDMIFPDERSMEKVLKEVGISPEEVVIVKRFKV